ncbi:MAG: histidine phosphatase family protein [Rhodobacteraceae bacterium]|nr:histidine phosphatase family protein [Paracoccaceae bacterium]
MVQIFLVRHGQANSEAKDEVSYDKLSPLGKIQAGWLGQYFKKNEFNFDVCFSGTLLRQRDTADLLECHNRKEIIRNPGLNEIQYYTLSTLVEQQFKKPPPKTGLDFEQHFEFIMSKWQSNEIVNVPESFVDFEERVSGMFEILRNSGDRVLVITSGGIIAKALQNCLGLSDKIMIKFLLASMNTGVTILNYSNGQFNVEQINALPHLDHSSRIRSRTYF